MNNCAPLSLTEHQVHSLDQFLLEGTGRALDALEGMFGLKIDSSESSIEIARADRSEHIRNLGKGALYAISSDVDGELRGSIKLLMRTDDFNHLGELMKPILSLMFLSSDDADLESLESQKPDWMRSNGNGAPGQGAFHDHMLDLLAELGNVLIGLYTNAIYKISRLNSSHSVPEARRDPNQRAVEQLLSLPAEPCQLHLVILNEFVIMNESIKLWCLISPTPGSFQEILSRIEEP